MNTVAYYNSYQLPATQAWNPFPGISSLTHTFAVWPWWPREGQYLTNKSQLYSYVMPGHQLIWRLAVDPWLLRSAYLNTLGNILNAMLLSDAFIWIQMLDRKHLGVGKSACINECEWGNKACCINCFDWVEKCHIRTSPFTNTNIAHATLEVKYLGLYQLSSRAKSVSVTENRAGAI